MKLYLGVDGGGTNARATIIGEDGTVVGSAHGSTANPFSVGDAAVDNLLSVVHACLDQTQDAVIDRAVYALAGVSTREDAGAFAERIRRSPLGAMTPRFTVTNDTIAALWSARCPLPAIVLVAGTGSHCLGVSADGSTARALGLEYVLTDDGGAFEIGLCVLRAVVRASDGRGPATGMTAMVAEALGARSLAEVFRFVHAASSLKTTVAGLAAIADRAAGEGDRIARSILRHAARSLSDAIRAVARRLEITATPCSLVLIGGVIRNSRVVREHLVRELADRFPLASTQILEVDASAGAALMAVENRTIDVWAPYERPIASDDPGPSSENGGT